MYNEQRQNQHLAWHESMETHDLVVSRLIANDIKNAQAALKM